MQHQVNDFQLLTELVNMKVENAVNNETKNITNAINDMCSEMRIRFTTIETKLGMSNETQSLIRAKIIEYAFKTGWLVFGSILASVTALLAMHLHF